MIRTPEEQHRHDEDSMSCMDSLQRIGRAYGRMIMQAVLAYNLDTDEIDAGIEAAVGDTRAFLESNGACEHDVEVALGIVRQAIIAEGKSIAVMLSCRRECRQQGQMNAYCAFRAFFLLQPSRRLPSPYLIFPDCFSND